GLVIGDPTVQDQIGFRDPQTGNLISGNGADGIDITAQGVATIGNNEITFNGTIPNATQIAHAGINIDGAERGPGQTGDFTVGFPTSPGDIDPDILAFRELWVVSNLISQNNGDGIELLSEGGIEFSQAPQSPGAIETALTIVRNEIIGNEGRGIDILQRTGDFDNLDRDNTDPDGVPSHFAAGTTTTDVTIIANHIKFNQLEGISVVQ